MDNYPVCSPSSAESAGRGEPNREARSATKALPQCGDFPLNARCLITLCLRNGAKF